MGVRRHVERHAFDAGLEIGAVVEVEAADEVLVGLAAAGVLGDDETRHGLEQLPFTADRPEAEIGGADSTLGSGASDADQVIEPAGNGEGVEHLGPRGVTNWRGSGILGTRGDSNAQREHW